MNKSALIEAAAAKAQVSKAEAARILDAALEAVAEAVKKGEGVQLIGFASIAVKQQAALNIPAKKVVRIKPGAKLAL